jgi:hypothetical protein
MGKRLRWMVSVATGGFVLGAALHSNAQQPTAMVQVPFDVGRCLVTDVEGGLTDADVARGLAVNRAQRLVGKAIAPDRGQSQ